MSRPADPRRGRHKKRRSPETIAWQRLRDPPARPSFVDEPTYNELLRLRQRLELDGRQP